MPEGLISNSWPVVAVGAVLGLAVVWRGYRRLILSFAKHPSLPGHVRMSKRFASMLPRVTYGAGQWTGLDGVDSSLRSQRMRSFETLVADFEAKAPHSLSAMNIITPRISDAQFTRRYRVPFQFYNDDIKKLRLANVWQSSEGVWLTDLDGQRYLDVSGSYGVNLFGLDFYKSTVNQSVIEASPLGPFLGGYHPSIVWLSEKLLSVSGMEEVSFHMSGTEAVMQAVRLARYNSGRRRIVRFCGAYHGWWDDVQPGPGNPMPPAQQTLTLRDMHPRTLRYLRQENDIACVLINPIQAMHPNRSAPTDSMLIDGQRVVEFDRQKYAAWLRELRKVCSERGIALIMDEVFLGFRLAPGGAQEYFGVKADLVTYGKTLGGGLPVGVLCGKSQWMKRYKDSRPADICFARGTFNAHPYVLTAMKAFLERIETSAIKAQYQDLDQTWNRRRNELNQMLLSEGIPVRFDGMPTVWTLMYTHPGRYHWLFQFYLRREGILMSWVGTGRFIFNLGFTESDFQEFCKRFVSAARRFKEDGWWAAPSTLTAKMIRRRVLWELLSQRIKGVLRVSLDL